MKKSWKDNYKPLKKPILYLDEDFPQTSLEKLKDFKVKHSTVDFDYSGRQDEFHFEFAANKKFILLTLDDDYLDNRKFKLINTYGVIIIKTRRFSLPERIDEVLDKLIPFLKKQSRESLKGTKIRVSLKGYIRFVLKDGKVHKEEVIW